MAVAVASLAGASAATAVVNGELAYASCVSASATPGCASATGMSFVQASAITADGANIYAPSFYTETIDGFVRSAADGSLQQLAGAAGSTPFIAGGSTSRGPYAVAVSPDGTSAYGIGFGFIGGAWRGALVTYSRDPSTGALSQTDCLTGDASGITGCTRVGSAQQGNWGNMRSVVVSPDGLDVYVAAGNLSAILEYRRDPTTGALTQNGCIKESGSGANCADTAPALSFPYSLAVSPDGGNVYAALFSSGGVGAFQRNAATGKLTPLAGTAACVTNAATPGCATSSNGAAADAPADGALSYPEGVAVSPDGANVYVGTQTGYLAEFTRDAGIGALSDLACLHDTTATARCAAAAGIPEVKTFAMPSGARMAYAASNQVTAIAAFSRRAGSGQLDQLASNAGCIVNGLSSQCRTVLQLDGSTAFVMSPDGAFLYAGGYSNIVALRPVVASPLTVGTAGSGSGRVIAPSQDIDCAANCTTQVANGSITLQAVADAGSEFTGWSGACSGTATTCTLAVGGPATAMASFGTVASSTSANAATPAAPGANSASTPGPPLLAVKAVSASRTGVMARVRIGAAGSVTVQARGQSGLRARGARPVCTSTKRVAAPGTQSVSCSFTPAMRRLLARGPVRLGVTTTLVTSAGERVRQSTVFTATGVRSVAPVTG